jgi:hypothetical protein
MTIRLIVLAVLLAGGGIVSAQAQLINPFSTKEPGLTTKDMSVVQSLSDKINNTPGMPVQSWTNPESGNAGTIRFVKAVQKQGRICHQLDYTFKETAPRPDSAYNMLWCKMPDRSWKLG